MGGLDGDKVAALLGVVMCMALVSRSSRLRVLSTRKRLMLGAVWAVIFGVVAGVAGIIASHP